MSGSFMRKMDLEIEIDVLTSGALAELVNSIFEFLLYQRNQIEFVYRTFRGFVSEWTEEESDAVASASASFNGYMLERQREKAMKTKESISEMKEVILNAFEKHVVKSLRFLFGSTTLTPKEAYTIHVPTEKVSSHHVYNHHQLPKMHVNQLLLTLLTKEDLSGVFSKDLGPTNLYLELETLETDVGTSISKKVSRLFPKQISKLPSSCKDIHLHLHHKLPIGINSTVLNCCRNLAVFNESDGESNGNNLKMDIVEEDCLSNWWETDVIVRGFKEKLVKGRSIWTKSFMH